MTDFLSFRRMLTPVLTQIVFWVLTAAAIAGGIYLLIVGNIAGLLLLLIGPLVIRIYAELIILGFQIFGTLTDIKNNTRLAWDRNLAQESSPLLSNPTVSAIGVRPEIGENLSGLSAEELIVVAERQGAVFGLPGPGRVSIDYFGTNARISPDLRKALQEKKEEVISVLQRRP